jgi:hypothetical protein
VLSAPRIGANAARKKIAANFVGQTLLDNVNGVSRSKDDAWQRIKGEEWKSSAEALKAD